MPKLALTDAGVRSLAPPEKGQRDHWDATFPGFGVRVSQGGSKTFILNIHNSRRAIGRFPILSLSDARSEARRLLAEKTLGKTRPQSVSFQAALQMFLEEKSKARRPRTVADLKSRLNRHFPFKGSLADASHAEVGRRLSRIPTNREHNHALRVGSTFFNWCVKRRYLSENPMVGFERRSTKSRKRILTDDELRQVWTAAGQIDGHFGTIV
jgi:hypothetical protein